MNPEKSPGRSIERAENAPSARLSTVKEADRDLGQSIENKRISVCRNRTACLPCSRLVAIDPVRADDVGILMGVGVTLLGDVTDDDSDMRQR